ncbi:hypothetical protein IMZ11_25320 [Microtetraspora sp. AC03309]|nr:hypothetical protein [Microtetraspora sp. AC03309]
MTVPSGKLTDGWLVRWRVRAVSAAASSAWSDWQSFTVSLPKPTATGLAITPSKVVDGVTVTTTLTPMLEATVTHPTGQTLRAEAEIEHDPTAPQGQGSGQIWTGSVDDVASGTQASLTVPAGELADGWKVRWRLRAVAEQVTSAWSDWQQVTVDVTQPGEEPLAQTTGPVIRTDQSFTVAAWLRWSDKDGAYTVIEQKGTHTAPFRLGNDPDRGLVFTFTSADGADAPTEGVLSDVEPPVNEWFHLAGVYDATAKTATLYLNGDVVKSEPISFPAWNAESPLTLGTSMRGDLDEVHALQTALPQVEVSRLYGFTDPVAASPESTATLRQVTMLARSRKFPYNRLTHEDCATAVGTPERPAWEASLLGPIRRAFYYKNSYNMCYAMWIGEREEDNDLEDENDLFEIAKWYGRLTLVFHTYVGKAHGNTQARDAKAGVDSRQVKVWARLDKVKFVDPDWTDRKLRIALGQNGLNCRATYVEDGVTRLAPHGREALVTNWRDGGDFEFTLGIPWDGLPHGDKVGTCSVEPYVNFTSNPDLTDRMWYLNPFFRDKKYTQSFVCDSADWITAYTGGCIVGSVAPIFILDANEKGKKSVEKSVENIYNSLYNPGATLPVPPAGVVKKVPGAWNVNNYGCARIGTQPGGCLHRTRDTAIHKKNRDVAIPACLAQRAYTRPESCDEYPFATTLEGAGSGPHFSVKIMHESDNCSSGSRLSVFYQRHRIRERSPFWVDVIQKGHTRPASGAPGIVATEAIFPEEILDLRGCGIDGVDTPIGPW